MGDRSAFVVRTNHDVQEISKELEKEGARNIQYSDFTGLIIGTWKSSSPEVCYTTLCTFQIKGKIENFACLEEKHIGEKSDYLGSNEL